MMPPLSLAFLTTADVEPVEAVRIAAATGYQQVGFRILPAAASGEADYKLFSDDSALREVRAALADTGITVADIEIVRLKADNDWALFDQFCDRCAAIGAKHVLVAGDDSETARLAGNFARFCAMAAARGLTGDLEFMPWTGVPDLAAARAVVAAAGSDNAGILIDALHFDRAGSSLQEVAALPPAWLHYVQFCDGLVPYDPSTAELIRIARTERLFPGMGGIDLVGLARAIPEDVTISIEVPHHRWSQRLDAHGRAAMAREATLAVLRAAAISKKDTTWARP